MKLTSNRNWQTIYCNDYSEMENRPQYIEQTRKLFGIGSFALLLTE